MKRKVLTIGLLILILLLGLAQVSWAGDFVSALNASIRSYPPTVNIAAMGGFWSALPNPFSSNPATYTTLKEYDLTGAAYASYNLIDFGQGPDIDLWVADGVLNLGQGVLRIDYFNLGSSQAQTKIKTLGQYLKGSIDGESLQIGYGYPINDQLSLGLTVIPVYSSDVKFEGRILDKQLTMAKGKNRTRGDFRLGLLYQPLDWLYLGLTYEHSRDKLETITWAPFGRQKIIEYPLTNLVRPGIVIQPWKGGTIGMDWLWGKSDNKKGKMDYDIDQWFFGIEQYLSPYFCLRIGSADGSLTGGIGLRKNFLLNIPKPIPIYLLLDYAYIEQSMKDMKPYLGRSSTHLIAITIAW